MSRTVSARFQIRGSALLSIVAAAVLVLPIPAGANPLPEAMVYFNVRPAGPPEDACLTEITDCADMTPSTEHQGPTEFQIFIDPQQAFHGAIPVPFFAVDLSWPEAWTLTDFRPCRGATGWSIDMSGPNPHHLEVAWPCTVPDGMFVAATLFFDVQGYGILDTSGDCTLLLDCPAYPVSPTANYAEAGTGCEYTSQPCATSSLRCLPEVQDLQLMMNAPEGGMAHGELAFTISGYPFPRCDFIANSQEPWAAGYVVSDENLRDAVLYVDADANGLEPGVYESEMQIAHDGFWGGPVQSARCLPVILTVESTTATMESLPSDAPRDPRCLELVGPNPSSGPFVFRYTTLTTSPVRCGIYDASGRKISSLVNKEQAAGLHTVTWRVVDAAGRRVRPGVYMVRLSGEAGVQSSRVVVLN